MGAPGDDLREEKNLAKRETAVFCSCGEALHWSCLMGGMEGIALGLAPGDIKEELTICPKCGKKWRLIQKVTENGNVSRSLKDVEETGRF